MSVISRDCQLGDHGVCSLGFGCVCKCHHPSVDERIGATERQEQARTIEDCHARIAELERQVEGLKSAFKPVEHWYDGDGESADFKGMLSAAVSDLVDDRAELLKRRPPTAMPKIGLCLVCAYDKPVGVWSAENGACVCIGCRDSRARAETAKARVKALEGVLIKAKDRLGCGCGEWNDGSICCTCEDVVSEIEALEQKENE